MKTKKETAGTYQSPSGQINKKLSVKKYTTPTRFGQFIFSSQTVISTNSAARDRGLVRCYGCLGWVETFGGFGLSVQPGITTAIKYVVCRKCFGSLSILPPSLQRKFAEKCEKNLRTALEGGSDV